MVAIVDIVVMFGIPTLSANRDVKTDTESVIWLRDHLGLQRYLTLGPINVNYGSYFGIGLAENNNVPLPKLWTNWLETHFKTLDPVNFPRGAEFGTVLNHPELLDDLAILYIVLPRRYGLPRSLRNTLRLVHRDKLATIYERPGTRPYFDVKNEPCSVLTISRTTVRTRCDHPTELVRREQFFPGWSAEVNGKDVPIRLAGELFQGISLPTGTSEIHFRYTPSYFPQGVLLFFAGCTWMLSAGVVIHRRCWTSRSQRRSASLLSSKNAPPTFVTEPYELGPGYDRFE